jgi:hypothetical protein
MYKGEIITCIESFFIFEKGQQYYCTREEEEYFYIHNKTGQFNVKEIKLSKKLKRCFSLTR